MIKVFGMARGGTNFLCNMIYSFPEVVRPRYSELQRYVYKWKTFSRVRIRLEKCLSINYVDVTNYDAHPKGSRILQDKVDRLRSKNHLIKVMNGNIAYYDAINHPNDKNIILLRNKLCVLGSMVRRGAKPVEAINNINCFYKYSEHLAKRDNLLVVKFEDIANNYDHVLTRVSDYLGYEKVDKVYLGLKGTLTSNRTGRTRIYVDIAEVPQYIDSAIDEKQLSQLDSSCGRELFDFYKFLLNYPK